MVEHGKDKAFDHIPKSSIAFIAKIMNVQRGISSATMPPRDHYKLQFDHNELRTLRGRVYNTMIDFEYSQIGEGIHPACDDIHHDIRKIQIKIPTIDHLYVVCLNENIRTINHLIEINHIEADDIIRWKNLSMNSHSKN